MSANSFHHPRFFSSCNALFGIIGFEGIFRQINGAWGDILGYSSEVLSNGLYLELVHPDDREATKDHLDRSAQGSDPVVFSNRLRCYDGGFRKLLWQITPSPVETAFYAVGIDTTDYTQTDNTPPLQTALRETKDYAATLIQTSPVFFIALTPEGKIIMLNETMLRTLHYNLEDVVGKQYLATLVPQRNRHTVSESLGTLAHNRERAMVLKIPVLTKNGRQVLVEWHFHAAKDVEGWKDYIFGVGIDIDERKKAKQQLHLFKTIVETSSEAISITAPDGQLMYVNAAWERLFTQLPREARTHNYRRYCAPQTLETFDQEIMQGMQAGKTWEGVLDMVNAQGHCFSAWGRFDAIFDISGNYLYSFGLMHDVSEQKAMEAALRYEHEQYEIIFNAAPLVIMYKDKQSRIIRANEYATKLVGSNRETFEGMPGSPSEVEYTEQYYADDQEVIRTGQAKRGIIERSKGSFFETDKIPFRDAEGNIQGVIVFATDISEYIQTEQTLNAEREQYETIFNAAPMMIIYKDRGSRIIRVNDYGAKLLGTSPEILQGRSDHELTIDYTDRYYEHDLEVIRSGKPKLGIIEKSKDRFFKTDKLPYRNAAGKISGVIVFAVDITACLHAEQSLLDNEERMKLAAKNMPVMLTAYDEQNQIILWNRHCEKMTGYSAEEIIGNPDAPSLLYPQAEYREYQQKALQRDDDFQWEAEITCKEGMKKNILWTNSSKQFSIPGWHHWMIGEDVTAHRKNQQAFSKNDPLLAAALDNLPAGICITDSSGRFVYVNAAWCRLYGYRSEELLDRPFTMLVPRDDYGAVLRYYFGFLGGEKESPCSETFRTLRRDGHSFVTQAVMYRLKQDAGHVYVVWTIAGDDVNEL
ncbi:MAG: PAS domain S-box protein [Gammaproteobacteria bacterium]|nr:PAS domain S-box protein [Gammaproteobacteria bacterium]